VLVAWGRVRLSIALIVTLTLIVYGALHLLAWRYNFSSKSERSLWQISAVITSTSGSILIAFTISRHIGNIYVPSLFNASRRRYNYLQAVTFVRDGMSLSIKEIAYVLIILNIASRAFLFVESFIALPNSPESTFVIPSWTAYVPHL
jgi:hypothetical protein